MLCRADALRWREPKVSFAYPRHLDLPRRAFDGENVCTCGGGSQVAIIYVLTSILGVGPEAATACALTLYVVTFLTVIPAGLIFGRVEHVSLSNVAKASEAEGELIVTDAGTEALRVGNAR